MNDPSRGPPAPPPEGAWRFVSELQAPMHGRRIPWARSTPHRGEVSLADGVRLDLRFPDPGGLLETAVRDFKRFLRAGGIRLGGDFLLSTECRDVGGFESHVIETGPDSCRLSAGDTEGVRRALVLLEDEILRRGGPFLRQGRIERRPFIRTRISRCFYGPIYRPPMSRDELADDVDYYPDEYLNRLAHEGINGLWLTIRFSDLCPSRFFPSHGRDSVRRLDKLRRTVAKCARHGIRIYVFCIEPRGFGTNPDYLLPEEDLRRNPSLGGRRMGEWTCFCTSSPEGLEYARECARHIFSEVPGLGGLIDINLNERPTHCYSGSWDFWGGDCPRCRKRKPRDVFRDLTSALAEGMQAANPRAEMISWLYVPHIGGPSRGKAERTESVIRDIAAHTPRDVILQYNFESNGRAVQLGRERTLRDYWLAWRGPSETFTACAKGALANGARVSAKIQAGCSHEVATVPFVPVPGNLYAKYSAMRRLGVSAVMQCWYFGNYPGIMNKAAGELSFEPFTEDEDAFLLRLARTDWGGDAARMVRAWKHFQEGYSEFPYNLNFTWYGPLHFCVAWPLFPRPVDRPVSPSWKFTFPLESGDRIGECIGYEHTLGEGVELLERMTRSWSRGVRILDRLETRHGGNPERKKDIGLARALGIQMDSALNVLRFYDEREELPYRNARGRRSAMARMKARVRAEIRNAVALRRLCLADSRLGFHSEAEGYRYWPEKLAWRAESLRRILREDFPALERESESGAPLFAEYTGVKPAGRGYTLRSSPGLADREELSDGRTAWKAWREGGDLCLEVTCPGAGADGIEIRIEPRRLWPAHSFFVDRNGAARHEDFNNIADARWKAVVTRTRGGWTARVRIPFALFDGFWREGRPMRMNVIRGDASWIAPLHPWEPRLRFGTHNPADLGFLYCGGGAGTGPALLE